MSFLNKNDFIYLNFTFKQKYFIGLHCFKHLGKIIAETTDNHPNISPFALELIEIVAKDPELQLSSLWQKALTPELVKSSAERKYLAIKLALHSLHFAEVDDVSAFNHINIFNSYHTNNIINQFEKKSKINNFF